MKFTLGGTPLTIASLGRMRVTGNTANHTLKLVDAATGVDMPNGSATVAMAANSGNSNAQYVYGSLAAPVTLQAGRSYLLVSQELQGGDQWYDLGAVPTPTNIAIAGPVYADGAGKFVGVDVSGASYGPLNMRLASTDVGSVSANTSVSLVTSSDLTTKLRNDYGGWVGMSFRVGGSPLTIESLGRMGVAGNTKTHVVKLVRAQDGTDVPNGSTSIAMAGNVNGRFSYGTLPTSVTLAANTSYLLVSQETPGGDSWYDYGIVSVSPRISVSGAVYAASNGYVTVNAPGMSYVPLDLKAVSGDATTTTTTATVDTAAISAPVIRQGAPTIVHYSPTEAAGETVVLFGDSFSKDGGSFGAQVWLLPNSTAIEPPSSSVYFNTYTAGTPLNVLQSTLTSAKVQLPNQGTGVYALQLWNANGASDVVFINRPEVAWWIGGLQDMAYAGQTLRVFGRNFNGNLRGWLRGTTGTYELSLVSGGKWAAKFIVPSNIPAGNYSFSVHNGMGGNMFGFSKSVPITVGTTSNPWPTKQFNVIQYGAKGNGTADDTAAFLNALKDAGINGGGTVYAPAGSYLVSQKLPIQPRTILAGDGPAATTLVSGAGVGTVIAGMAHFQVTNLGIKATVAHRVITCPDDAQMYNDWGISQNPATACADVAISNVTIQHTTSNFVVSGYELATRTLHFFGSDILVKNSTIHSQGMPTSFFNAHHVMLSGNHFFVGFYCMDGFWNADQSVYEFNEHAAEPGTSGDGLFVQGTSKQLYFEGNNFHDSLGTYGEGIVAGDGPYPPFWFGVPNSSTATSLTVANAGWTAGAQVGHAVYVVNGKGMYQRRRVIGNTVDTLHLDSPLDVALDSTSYVSLEIDHSDGIFYNNQFANVSSAVLLYSQSYGFVVDQNQGAGTGGSTCVAWNFDSSRNSASPNVNRWFNNCYFNEWTGNNFSGSLNSTNPNKRGGQVPVIGKTITGISEYIANTAVVGPILDPTWMIQPQTENDYAIPVVGNIVRGNIFSSVTDGANQGSVIVGGVYNWPGNPLSCGWETVNMPAGGATGTLVEGNSFANSGGGVYFDPLFAYTLIRNNNFAGTSVVSDASFTTCSGVSGRVAAIPSPFSTQP